MSIRLITAMSWTGAAFLYIRHHYWPASLRPRHSDVLLCQRDLVTNSDLSWEEALQRCHEVTDWLALKPLAHEVLPVLLVGLLLIWASKPVVRAIARVAKEA